MAFDDENTPETIKWWFDDEVVSNKRYVLDSLSIGYSRIPVEEEKEEGPFR